MVYYVHSIARKWNLEAAEQMLKAVSAKSGRTLRSETLKIATYSLSLSLPLPAESENPRHVERGQPGEVGCTAGAA